MKRSQHVSLVLLASVSAVTLGACDDQKPAEPADTQVMGDSFTNKQECMVNYDESTCDTAMAAAQADHIKNAPTFSTLAECEAQYGAAACSPQQPVGGNTTVVVDQPVYIPNMGGFMIGIGNGGLPLYTPYYYGACSVTYGCSNRPIFASGGIYFHSGVRAVPMGYVYQPAGGGVRGSFARSVIVSPSLKTGGMPAATVVQSTVSRAAPVSQSVRGGFSSTGSVNTGRVTASAPYTTSGARTSTPSVSTSSSSARGGFGGGFSGGSSAGG